MKNLRNESLDGLRGLAAIYVIVFHVVSSFPQFGNYNHLMKSVVLAGASMVQVFFVLSGYFIFQSIEHLYRHSQTPIKSFLVRRFLRIMPLWAVLLSLMYLKNEISLQVLLANLVFYFGNLEFHQNQWLPIVPAWSLQSEVLFYILSMFFMRKILLLNPSRALVLFSLNIFIAGSLNYFLYNFFHISEHTLKHYFLGQSYYFLSGFFIYLLTKQRSVDAFLNQKSFWIFEISVVCMFLFHRANFFHTLNITLLAPAIVLIALSRQSLLRLLFKTKVMQLLGWSSFSIYILQDQASIISSAILPDKQSWSYLFIHVLACSCIGVLSFLIIERPFLNLSKKY